MTHPEPFAPLEIGDLMRLLPHRPPMLMLDRVTALEPGRRAEGCKLVTGNEYGLSSRRHGFVFPSTLVLEALVQLATVALTCPRTREERTRDEHPPVCLLGAIESMVVEQEMSNGSPLDLAVTLEPVETESGGRIVSVRVTGSATLNGKLFVRSVFVLRAMESPDSARAE